MSIGFGVFMGIVPIWGFQLAIAILLSFLLRLNKVMVILAANISIPPMIPVIIYLSHRTGGLWMGQEAQRLSFSNEITFEILQSNFLQYVLGAVTLAIACGVIFGVVTFVGLKLFKRSKT